LNELIDNNQHITNMKSICQSSYFEPIHFEPLTECQPKSSTSLLQRESSKGIRASIALPRMPASVEVTRDYFRSLRAAEMATWELTGGDYLRSSFVRH
jgi:hypothetical protein